MRPSEPVPSYGRKTKYRGIEFKSKCEARWAALLDLLGQPWEYEPNGPCTFPDFVTECEPGPLYIEVKGSLVSSSVDGLVRVEVPEGSDHAIKDYQTGNFYVEMPKAWVRHPDAIKARASALGFVGPVAIACRDGRLWFARKRETRDKAETWFSAVLVGQSEYFWDRTAVMVTGQGKE